MIPWHCEQLNFISSLANNRPEFLDPLFLFLNYFDSPYFVMALVPFVWVGFSWRWGLRLFYLIAASVVVNTFFKELVGWPRPCADCPSVGMLCLKSFGFPSGGAQTCMLLGGLLIYTWKTRWAWIVGVSYIALISFSRLYLGVHYPIDVLGGWVLGLGLLWLYVRTIGPIEQFLHRQRLEACLGLSFVLPIALMLATTSPHYFRVDAVAIGIGAYLSLKWGLYLADNRDVRKGVVRGVLAVGLMWVGLVVVRGHLPTPWVYGVLALWLSLGVSPLVRKIVCS